MVSATQTYVGLPLRFCQVAVVLESSTPSSVTNNLAFGSACRATLHHSVSASAPPAMLNRLLGEVTLFLASVTTSHSSILPLRAPTLALMRLAISLFNELRSLNFAAHLE